MGRIVIFLKSGEKSPLNPPKQKVEKFKRFATSPSPLSATELIYSDNIVILNRDMEEATPCTNCGKSTPPDDRCTNGLGEVYCSIGCAVAYRKIHGDN